MSVLRLCIPVDSTSSKTSQQKRVEGIRGLGLGSNYRHERSHRRQQKRSVEEG